MSVEVFLPGCLIWVLWAPADKTEGQVIIGDRQQTQNWLTMLP